MANRAGAVFIVSDLHLGTPTQAESLEREKRLVAWLEWAAPQAQEIIILGDLFDFWFEYTKVIPRGFARIMGTLARLTDAGLPITLFRGNHDLWLRDYFPKELGVAVQKGPMLRQWFGRNYFLAHGDGLGPGDHRYKLMKWAFRQRLLQWAFASLHPRWGVGLAHSLSGLSRRTHQQADARDYGEKEFLFQFVKRHSPLHPQVHAYVFGHRHVLRHQQVGQAQMYILGHWFDQSPYLRIDVHGEALQCWQPELA